MYVIHDLNLVVLVSVLYERVKNISPRLAIKASGLGFIRSAFTPLCGYIKLWGNEALIALYGKAEPKRK